VPDDALTAATPCPQYVVGDLLDHIGGLTVAFTRAAVKDLGEAGSPPPGDASLLGDDWRTRIVADLDALAEAWKQADAWQGMTRAGGIDMPGEIAGVVAADDATADAVLGFYSMFGDDDRGDAFGPAVSVPESASKLDQVVGASGRNPKWPAG
jgi:hypothetical protein